MGGTSTDVCRVDLGELTHIYENYIANTHIATPHLDINTVAAGGGSKLFFVNGMFKVGPESAGSYPGPVCYGFDGFLTVCDANLLLGRL